MIHSFALFQKAAIAGWSIYSPIHTPQLTTLPTSFGLSPPRYKNRYINNKHALFQSVSCFPIVCVCARACAHCCGVWRSNKGLEVIQTQITFCGDLYDSSYMTALNWRTVESGNPRACAVSKLHSAPCILERATMLCVFSQVSFIECQTVCSVKRILCECISITHFSLNVYSHSSSF